MGPCGVLQRAPPSDGGGCGGVGVSRRVSTRRSAATAAPLSSTFLLHETSLSLFLQIRWHSIWASACGLRLGWIRCLRRSLPHSSCGCAHRQPSRWGWAHRLWAHLLRRCQRRGRRVCRSLHRSRPHDGPSSPSWMRCSGLKPRATRRSPTTLPPPTHASCASLRGSRSRGRRHSWSCLHRHRHLHRLRCPSLAGVSWSRACLISRCPSEVSSSP